MNRREIFHAIVNHQQPERILIDYVIDRCRWDWMSATDLIVMIPVFILSMTIRKHFVQGMTMEAVK